MEGGTQTENLALQNIQARSRMVMSYFMAQLMPLIYKSCDPLRGHFAVYDVGRLSIYNALCALSFWLTLGRTRWFCRVLPLPDLVEGRWMLAWTALGAVGLGTGAGFGFRGVGVGVITRVRVYARVKGEVDP